MSTISIRDCWDEMESLAKEVMLTPPDVVGRMRKLLGES